MPTDDELIAEYLAKRGATKCPAAIAAPTTATLDAEAARLHAARGIDPAGDAWRAGNKTTVGWAAYWQRKRAAAGAVMRGR